MTSKADRDKRAKLLLSPQLLKDELAKQQAGLKDKLAVYQKQTPQTDGLSSTQIREYVNFQKGLSDLKKQLSNGKIKLEQVKEELKNICNSFTQAFA